MIIYFLIYTILHIVFLNSKHYKTQEERDLSGWSTGFEGGIWT